MRRAGAGLAAVLVIAAAGAAILALTRLGPSPEPFAVVPIRIDTAADPRPAMGTETRSASAPAGLVKLAPAPDQRLVEASAYGMLPRIGPDGSRPARVYARPVPPALTSGPQIAIVVGGLGIGQSATADAIARLPPEITLAFAPYGDDLERSVAKARSDGHEVLLQVPMEPFDYPDSDPGPHTLTTQARAKDNLDRLHWVMGRFTGYVGIVNLMGAKLTADAAALKPILEEIGARGLFFLDDGSSARSVVASSSFEPVPTGRSHLVLDGVARPDAIDTELRRLEEAARRDNLAIGTANALPVTIERIALWAKELESAGIRLVPVSFAFEGHASQ